MPSVISRRLSSCMTSGTWQLIAMPLKAFCSCGLCLCCSSSLPSKLTTIPSAWCLRNTLCGLYSEICFQVSNTCISLLIVITWSQKGRATSHGNDSTNCSKSVVFDRCMQFEAWITRCHLQCIHYCWEADFGWFWRFASCDCTITAKTFHHTIYWACTAVGLKKLDGQVLGVRNRYSSDLNENQISSNTTLAPLYKSSLQGTQFYTKWYPRPHYGWQQINWLDLRAMKYSIV